MGELLYVWNIKMRGVSGFDGHPPATACLCYIKCNKGCCSSCAF